MASLSEILIQAQSGMQPAMEQANAVILQQKQTNAPQLLLDLSVILYNENENLLPRQIAAIQIKNILKNAQDEEFLVGLWDRVPPEMQAQIRQNTLYTLASPAPEARKYAAQAVAQIGQFDLPKGTWPELLTVLITNATNVNVEYKHAALMTLGFICEQLDPSCIIKEQSDAILTAICASILPDQTDLEVKASALVALQNALVFVSANFSNDAERDYLMNVILQACRNEAYNIKIQALRVLCDVGEMYYDKIGQNLKDIWDITSIYIQHDDQIIGMLAIEFWNVIADIEKTRMEHLEQTFPVRGYIAQACDMLVPLLLGTIKCEDIEEWSKSKSAISTLQSVAGVIKDRLVDLTETVYMDYLASNDPQYQIAALNIISTLLNGPSEQRIGNAGYQAGQIALGLLKSDLMLARFTASWFIAALSQTHLAFLISAATFNDVMSQLLDSLKDASRVTNNICWSLIVIVEKIKGTNFIQNVHFQHLINVLIQTAYRQDRHNQEFEITIPAFYALIAMIEHANVACEAAIIDQLQPFIERLQNQSQGVNQLQPLICSALQAILMKIPGNTVNDQQAQTIMHLIIQLFQNRGAVFEEGLYCVGALALNIEMRFNPYLQMYKDYLLYALADFQAASACKAATISLGDICRAIGTGLQPIFSQSIEILIRNLQSDQVSTEIKVHSIDVLGDLANACKEEFIHYKNQVLPIIEGAAGMSLQLISQQSQPDLYEFLMLIREAIVQFYTGMLTGLYEINQHNLILESIPKIIEYLIIIARAEYRPSSGVHLLILGLIGDIAKVYGQSMRDSIRDIRVEQYIDTMKTNQDPEVSKMAEWTQQRVREF